MRHLASFGGKPEILGNRLHVSGMTFGPYGLEIIGSFGKFHVVVKKGYMGGSGMGRQHVPTQYMLLRDDGRSWEILKEEEPGALARITRRAFLEEARTLGAKAASN